MSLRSGLINQWARIRKADRRMAELLKNPPRGTQALKIDNFTEKVRIKRWTAAGFPGITVNGSYPKRCHILFLPGGGYTLEPVKGHQEIAQRFAAEDHMKVSVFCYPLSPEYTAEETHAALLTAYEQLLFLYPDDDFYLLGDGAGGGLALSFLQGLKQMGILPLPKRTALVSPWLDISLSNPRIKLAKKTDYMVPVGEMAAAGNIWRGLLEPDDPIVSPLYGPMEGLGPILVFSGTEEVLTPDCELLAEKMESAEGTGLVFRKAAHMYHDWILKPCAETDAALDLIAGFFLEEEEPDTIVVEAAKGLTKTVSKESDERKKI